MLVALLQDVPGGILACLGHLPQHRLRKWSKSGRFWICGGVWCCVCVGVAVSAHLWSWLLSKLSRTLGQAKGTQGTSTPCPDHPHRCLGGAGTRRDGGRNGPKQKSSIDKILAIIGSRQKPDTNHLSQLVFADPVPSWKFVASQPA